MTRRHRAAGCLALATAHLGAATCCAPAPAPATIHHDAEPDTLAVQGWVVEAMPATTTSEAPTTTEAATTTTTEPAPEPVATTARRRPTTTTIYEPPAPQGRTTRQGGAPLACIRSYEQGAGGYASATGNGYYGAYQFDLATWRSVGGAGLPSDAEPWEQDMRAQMLYDREGLAPWPTPAVACR